MINQPIDYWRILGKQTRPELEGLALEVFAQTTSTSTSCYETNLSTFDIIYSKWLNLLGVKAAVKLKYIYM